MAGYLPSGPIDSGLSWSPIIFNNRDPYAPVQFPTAMSMDKIDLGSGITEVIGNVVTLPQVVTNHIQTVGEEWYHRIHLIPSKKELGNLLTAQTVDIEVWNGFLVSRTLNDITEERTEGITLTQPALPPLTYGILESKDYQVNVSVIGPPTVDGIYSFNFDVYPVLFNVTGNRVVVWPFVPDSDFVEILEWKTDIIQTKSTEQRISLRPVPRQSFNYRYLLSDREFASVKVIMAEWAQRSFSVPMWPDAEYVGPLSAGLTTLPIDDSQIDIVAGGAALIYEGPNSFEAIEIQDVNVGSVTLKNPTIFSYTKAFIIPIISSKANDGFSVSRDKTSFITGSCDFTGTTTNDLAFSGETQYKSKDILLDPNAYVSSISEKIYREVDVHDSGVGIYSFEEKRNTYEHDQMLSFHIYDRDELWRVRTWLHSKKGKQKSFYVLSWHNDLNIQTDLVAADTSLVVEDTRFSLYFKPSDIAIIKKDGDILLIAVTGAVDLGNGTEQIVVDQQIGEDLLVSDIDKISFVYLVRMDADRIEIKHTVNKQATIVVPLKKVSE